MCHWSDQVQDSGGLGEVGGRVIVHGGVPGEVGGRVAGQVVTLDGWGSDDKNL